MTWQNYFPLSKGTTVFFNAIIDKMNSRAKMGHVACVRLPRHRNSLRGRGLPAGGEQVMTARAGR